MSDTPKSELTPEDKQRIEQWADRLWKLTSNEERTPFEALTEMAEYATLYERQQQAKLHQRVQELEAVLNQEIGFNDIKSGTEEMYQDYAGLFDKCSRLEAGHVELTNKVTRLEKLNEYLEAILTKSQSRTYEHYKVITENLP